MKKRLHFLDALRGFLLVNMIAFHGLWNLVYLFGVKAAWYTGIPGYIWQQSVCWMFFLLSGFCFRLGRKPLKRGLIVFGGGLAVTAVTCIAMPESRIFWGVLTCLGSCMILLTPLEKVLRKIPSGLGLAISFGLFALLRNVPVGSLGFEKLVLYPLPVAFYRNLFTAYLGFPPQNFFSADYFPLIPWFFLFTAGYFLFRFLNERNLNERLFARGEVPVLNWLGRNSLIVYLLHQPVLYGLCLLFF
jgi:uncharacterized membrane protein